MLYQNRRCTSCARNQPNTASRACLLYKMNIQFLYSTLQESGSTREPRDNSQPPPRELQSNTSIAPPSHHTHHTPLCSRQQPRWACFRITPIEYIISSSSALPPYHYLCTPHKNPRTIAVYTMVPVIPILHTGRSGEQASASTPPLVPPNVLLISFDNLCIRADPLSIRPPPSPRLLCPAQPISSPRPFNAAKRYVRGHALTCPWQPPPPRSPAPSPPWLLRSVP